MSVAGGVSFAFTNDVQAPYSVNNILDGDPTYIGKVTPDGRWLLVSFSPSTGVMAYANSSNNSGYPTYSSAWSARLSLSYGPFESLTGV